MKNRVEIMHGVNFDVLDRRDPEIYGGLSLTELEVRIKRFAHEFGFEASFEQTNHEGEFCENLHKAALLNVRVHVVGKRGRLAHRAQLVRVLY